MTYQESTQNKMYQNLGKLFYAVAMADKNVRPKEVATLREAVREQWLDVDEAEDEFGTDAAYQIEIVFDWLHNEESDGDSYFKEFKYFFKEHRSLFTKRISEQIYKTARAIAVSFAGTNKSELVLLTKLKMLLEQE
ncbi:hypothetical protein [Ulvibacterium sp.]|uniref:hypothetical protein n=1 Tax=Ulvibacterium sp. TaxID=2665914 RepID=UPI0026342683|nr:hypothetical protein [Ulvibacterium sp.]